MDLQSVLVSVVCVFAAALAQNAPPVQHMQQKLQHDEHRNVLKDKNRVQDQQHIMEHMDGKYKTPEDQMSEQELQFHYFKLHDYDNNNMLDGIELVSAITHFHKEDEDGNEIKDADTDFITSTVDEVLIQGDVNNDGYLTYAEFMRFQFSDTPTTQNEDNTDADADADTDQ